MEIKDKNKKGMLLASELLKIVLSLIGIVLLIYLLVSIYYARVDGEKLLQAKATLEKISQSVEVLNVNSSYVGEIFDVTPSNWVLFSYTGSRQKPNSCFGEDCVCICDEVGSFQLFSSVEEKQLKECSSKGACVRISNLKDFGKITIKDVEDGSTNLKIRKDGKWVEVISA
ncbi:hypothetical protein B6U91_02185 [Candidatus Pacearchaeota archaeon ex4484_71]|nr:MAG: hypothetical protein B6U91_02185 [Candidatus Pacearchaeota archaeon ex4484_71]